MFQHPTEIHLRIHPMFLPPIDEKMARIGCLWHAAHSEKQTQNLSNQHRRVGMRCHSNGKTHLSTSTLVSTRGRRRRAERPHFLPHFWPRHAADGTEWVFRCIGARSTPPKGHGTCGQRPTPKSATLESWPDSKSRQNQGFCRSIKRTEK